MLQTLATDLQIAGIGHVALLVADLASAKAFYCEILGLRESAVVWPRCGDSIVLATARGELVILTAGAQRDDFMFSAAHVGFALSPMAHARALAAVAKAGGEIHAYREDRPAEAAENFYVCDPSGNRIQLLRDDMQGEEGVARIDHVAIEVSDILWIELTLAELFGWEAVFRVGWTTDDYLKAKAAGEAGMREAMPGSRYWNQRYSPFEAERRALRPCPQLYFAVGDAMLVVYLAARRFQAMSDDVVVGAPRIGLTLRENRLETLADLLRGRELICEGPVRHATASTQASVYWRDLSGNFIEFYAPGRA